jgi:hypothetical protein
VSRSPGISRYSPFTRRSTSSVADAISTPLVRSSSVGLRARFEQRGCHGTAWTAGRRADHGPLRNIGVFFDAT